MRILIVDDEKPAREELAWLLEQCDLSATAQAANAQEALRLLEKLHPVDLIFLDIDMPGLDGLRLSELLQDRFDDQAPQIVFVTAYKEHAVDAFAVDATDYLLKPLRLARLKQALERAKRRLQSVPEKPPLSEIGDAPSTPLKRISVEELGAYRVISVDEILWIVADEGFATVHTAKGDFLTDFSLKFLEENLDQELFFRCHRSYIVRLDAIHRITPTGAGTYRLIVGDDASKTIPLARSRAPELKARIPWSAQVL